MSRTCACRRSLTEAELFFAHGNGGLKPLEHDDPTHDAAFVEQVPPDRVAAARPRATITVLTSLQRSERRLAVAGR